MFRSRLAWTSSSGLEQDDRPQHSGNLPVPRGHQRAAYEVDDVTLRQGDEPQFGRIPYDVVDAGGVAAMRAHPTDALVYLVIAAHVNGKSWSCALGVSRIATLAGVSKRTVQRSTSHLATLGLITVAKGGGRARCNRYTVVTNCTGKPGRLHVSLSCEKPGHPDVTLSAKEPGHPATETRTPAGPKRDTQIPKPRHPSVRPTEEQREQTTTDDVASPHGASSPVVVVGDSSRERTEKLTFVRDRFGTSTAASVSQYLGRYDVDYIQTAADEAIRHNNPPAWFHAALRHGYDLKSKAAQSPEQAAANRSQRHANAYRNALDYMKPAEVELLPKDWQTVEGLLGAAPLTPRQLDEAPADVIISLFLKCGAELPTYDPRAA